MTVFYLKNLIILSRDVARNVSTAIAPHKQKKGSNLNEVGP